MHAVLNSIDGLKMMKSTTRPIAKSGVCQFSVMKGLSVDSSHRNSLGDDVQGRYTKQLGSFITVCVKF